MIGTQSTNIFEIGIVISIALLYYFLIYMKYCLYKKGMGVNWFLQWGSDYQRFKSLIESEKDEDLKKKYIGAVYGLKLSAVLLVLVAVAGFIFTKFRLWGFI
jgi:hypothetical protein